MRPLTQQEMTGVIDDDDYLREEGCVPIEALVEELAEMGVGTACGHHGNQTFKALEAEGYGDRLCRGWYDDTEKVIWGMPHIQAPNEEDGMKIDELASQAGGSLRYEGESKWPGFLEFEIE